MAPVNKNIVCAGCPTLIQTKQYLKCSLCSKTYDVNCAGLNEKLFDLMDRDRKDSWKCQECRNKEPRKDNTNTPVRPAMGSLPPGASGSHSHGPSNDDDESSNVNRRKRRNVPPPPPKDKEVLTVGSLREIIKEELAVALKTVISQQVTKQLKSMTLQMTSFQESIDFYNAQFEDLKTRLEEKCNIISLLESDNEKLKTSYCELKSSVNVMEQQARSNNMEIQCVPENKSENLVSTVLQLGRVLDCDVTEADISHCTRIAKLNTQNQRPRSIVVKFNTQRSRDKFITGASKFNKTNNKDKLNTSHLGIACDRPQPVYVVEHLTPENKDIHAAARTRARELGFKHVWVRSGRVLMRETDASETILVRNKDFLKTLVSSLSRS